MTEFTVTYAQNREDNLLESFFPGINQGFYVDVGAHDPTLDSVTRKFYERGWRGINIEPNKRLLKAFEIERPYDINLELGISDKEGKLTLRDYQDGPGLSTFSKEIQRDYSEHTNEVTKHYKDVVVPVTTLAAVFKAHAVGEIHFMKIDVEGYEYEVILGNDWKKYRPQVLCIESSHILKDWRPLLKSYGYQFIFYDGLNDYYVANEHKELGENFSYPDAVLAKVPIPHEYHKKLKLLSQQLRQAEQQIVHLGLVEQGLVIQLNTLNAQLVANRRIRSLVKQLLSAMHRAIQIRIENLNKPRVRPQPAIQLQAAENLSDILQTIRRYDLNRYYSYRSSEPVIYRLTKWLYLSCSRVAYLSLRALRRRHHE